MNDPIVDEIRKYREAHAARFNYDLDAIYRDIKEREKEWEEKTGRKFEPPPSVKPAAPVPPISANTSLSDGTPVADHNS